MVKDQDKDSLFSEFHPVSSAEWINKAEQDLKGSPYDKLQWEVTENIKLRPFYREEDVNDLDYLMNEPGCFPFVRTGKKAWNTWHIRQDIIVKDITSANVTGLNAINNGADSLFFEFKNSENLSGKNIEALLKGIDLPRVNLNFSAPGNEEIIISSLSGENSISPSGNHTLKGALYFDPLGQLCTTGNYYVDEKTDFIKLSSLIRSSSAVLPDFRMITLNGTVFHNAGGDVVQELAFSLASASEYLDRLTDKGFPVDTIASNLMLNLSVGPHYFIEIAKFRVARLLFSNLLKAWKIQNTQHADIYIHATTSERNQTVFDPYMNMLRGTTGGMSAILGGVDSLTIQPFGKSFRKPTDFGERIARNTQIILKEEAYFDKVKDAAGGAYYIERITDSLAEAAWDLFRLTEKNGGFSASLKSGFIQNTIQNNARKQDLDLATRKQILVGTNQYPDPDEKPNFDCETMVAFPVNQSSNNSFSVPVTPYRASTAFETLRIRTLKHSPARPKVFLLNYGNPKWASARAAFSANFFGCAGYEIIQPDPFHSVREGVNSALKAGASLIVLCSPDEEYPVIAPETVTFVKNNSIIVIAGFPKENIEYLKSCGIQHFIHVNSNILVELEKFHALLGIK